ncbi:MAG: response regulator [Spirochaetes bacterium]|nr:response regulator [Spirochaetota bacterium]
MDKKQILLAEDEFTSRKLLEFQLNRLHILFDAVATGVDALEYFRRGSYKLVLLDEYMPGLNGSEVAKEIRKIDPSIPLLAMTSDPEAVPRLKNAGFQEVFVKPLHGKAHLDIIIGYLA